MCVCVYTIIVLFTLNLLLYVNYIPIKQEKLKKKESDVKKIPWA